MATTDALCRSFLDLWWHFDPAAATWTGSRQDADGRLGGFDADAMRQHLAAFRSIAGAVEELEVEEAADEIDRTALLDHLRVLQFQLEGERPWQRNPALWLEHLASAFEGLLARPPEQAATAALARLRAVPRFLKDATETLRHPPLFLLDTALAQLPAVAAVLEAAAERFAEAWSADAGEAAQAMTEARSALEQFGSGLRDLLPDPDPHAAAVGEEALDRRLHYEHASIHNAPESWRAALRLATEVESEVSACAAVVEAGRPWRDLYVSLLEDAPVWGELRAELREALDRVEAEGPALTELPDEALPVLEILPLSEASRLLEPVATYRPAGATPAALLIGDPDPRSLPWLAARLGSPGLHLHRTRTAALPGAIRRHIGASSTPSGWGLYVQVLLAERGWLGSPEARFAERALLLGEVHLAIADLGLHTRQLTPEEAIGQLTGQALLDPAAALAQVRRIACRPGSAWAAILGYQELVRLRDDARAARGPEFSLAGFHDELLGYGGLPVPLIRWGMGLDE